MRYRQPTPPAWSSKSNSPIFAGALTTVHVRFSLLALLTVLVLHAIPPTRAADPPAKAPAQPPSTNAPAVAQAPAPLPVVTLAWPQDATLEATTPVRDRRGTPFFPLELYSLRNDEDFRIAQFLGFNSAIEDGPDAVALAARHGFHITEASWLFEEATPETIADAIRGGIGAPNLTAYNLNDEPDLRTHSAPPDALVRIAAQLRAIDPDAKTSLTLAGNSWSLPTWPDYAKAADIIRVDPYPLISGKPIRQVTDHVLAARRAAPGKPVICVLQAWTWGDQPLPSPAQVHHMAAQALIAGANGLSWFDWNDAVWDVPFSAAIRHVNTGKMLKPLVAQAPALPYLEQDGIAARAWRKPDGHWQILILDLRDPESGDHDSPATERRTVNLQLPAGFPQVDHVPIFPVAPTADTPDTFPTIDQRHLRIELGPGDGYVIQDDIREVWLTQWADSMAHPRWLHASPWADEAAGRTWGPVNRDYYPRYAIDRAGRAIAPYPDPINPCIECATKVPDAQRPYIWLDRARVLDLFSGPAVYLPPSPIADATALEPTGPYASRFRVFPGGRFTWPLNVICQLSEFLDLRALTWEGSPAPHLEGDDLASLVSLTRAPAPQPDANTNAYHTLFPFTLTLSLPKEAADWNRRRDHLLSLRLRFLNSLVDRTQSSNFDRVLRFRIEEPFAAAVEWESPPPDDFGAPPTAHYLRVSITPTFPLACYPDPDPATWQLRLPGPPLAILPTSTLSVDTPTTTDTDRPTTLTQRFRLTPLPGPTNTEARLIPLTAELQIGDITFPLGLTSVQLANGHLYPSPPVEFIAPCIEGQGGPIESAPGTLSPATFQSLSNTITRAAAALPPRADANTETQPPLLPPFTQWSSPYSNDYTGVGHRVSFAWDSHYLTLLADLEGSHDRVRAEMHTPNQGFRADDTLLLVLQLHPDGSQTYIQFNPNAQYRTAVQAADQTSPRPADSHLLLRTTINKEENRWQALLQIPWSDLTAPNTPPPHTLQFILQNTRRIAPREHFSLTPPAPEHSGPATGTLHLLPESAHAAPPGTP